jgi:hypothetical protein
MQISRLTFLGACWKPRGCGLKSSAGMQLFPLIFEIICALERERGGAQLSAMKILLFASAKPHKTRSGERSSKTTQKCNNKTGRPEEQVFFHPRVFLRTCYQSFRLRWLGELISNNRTRQKTGARGGILCSLPISTCTALFSFYTASPW